MRPRWLICELCSIYATSGAKSPIKKAYTGETTHLFRFKTLRTRCAGRGAAAAVSAGPGGGGKRTLVRGGRQGGRRRPCESGAGVNAQQRRMTIAALAARRDGQRWLHTWRGGEGGTPLLLGGGAPLCDADRVCARHSRYVTTKGSEWERASSCVFARGALSTRWVQVHESRVLSTIV